MRGDGTRAHAPTSGRGRGRARTRSPSSAARPRSATLCAPAQTFPRGSERRCEAFAARASTLRARSRPVPSELPPACGWGRCGRGFLSLAHPDFPHYCGYWSSKKRGVAGGAAGCVGALLFPRAHSRTMATALPQASRTVRSLHRFALLLPLEWTLSPTMSSQACSSPRAFLIPPPSLFPLTVSRQSPLLIHVIPWASFPFLNTGTPQPSWPTSCPLECSLRLDQALVFLDSPFLPEFVGLLPYLPPSPHARITLNGPCCSHWYPCTIWFGGAQGKHPAGSRTSADLPIQYPFLLCPASCPLMAQLAVYLSLLSPLLLQDEPHCLPMRGGEENGLQLSLVWAALSKMALAYFCNISILQREGPKEALRQRRQGS